MFFRVGTIENSCQDVQANVPAGNGALYPFQGPATICENQSGSRLRGEELPKNTILRDFPRVSEPPAMFEHPRGFPARDFAGNIHPDVLMVLHHLAANTTVEIDTGTKPCLDIVWLGQHGPNPRWRVRDMAIEDHFVAVLAPSNNRICSHVFSSPFFLERHPRGSLPRVPLWIAGASGLPVDRWT